MNAKRKLTVPVNPNDGAHEIMALAGQSWGRGPDATSARQALHQHTSLPVERYFIVPKGAWLDEVLGNRVSWALSGAADVHQHGQCALCSIE